MNNTDDTNGLDNDADAQDTGTGKGPAMTRRRMLQATAATGAAAAVGTTGFTGSVAAAEGDGDWIPSDGPQAVVDYVARDTGTYQMYDSATRTAVGLATLTTPLSGVVAGVTAADTAIEATNEFLFGSHDPGSGLNADAHTAAWHHIGDSAISIRDALAAWEKNDLEALKYLAFSIMESEGVKALNDKETKGAAKTRAKQKIRDEVIVTPERNLIRLAEALCIRLTGIYWVWVNGLDSNGYMADDDGDGTLEPRTSSFWHLDAEDHSNDVGEYIYQFGNPQKSTYTLVNGEELNVGMAQVILTEPANYDDNDETYNLFPVGDRSRFSVKPDRYNGGGIGNRPRRLMDEVGFYYAPESDMRSVSDYIGTSQIRTLHSDLMTLQDNLDTEVENYIDSLYSKYDPGDIVNPEDRTPGSLVYDSGANYTKTGNADYSEIWAALTGMPVSADAGNVAVEVMSGGAVDNTRTGVLIPQTAPSNLPKVQYAAENYTVDPSAGTYGEIAINRAKLVPGGQTYEWVDGSGTSHTITISNDATTETVNDSGDVTGYVYLIQSGDDAPAAASDISSDTLRSQAAGMTVGQTSTAYTYVAGQEENDTGDLEGRMYTIDPSTSGVDKWRIKSIEKQWFVTFERVADKQATVNNDELEALWEKYAELAKKQAEADEDEGITINAGGAGGSGLGVSNPLLLAAGGGIAALLATLGISGAGGD